jgi:RES domain-containing protein
VKKQLVPERLFRAHSNADGPLAASTATGGGRFDDYRVPPRFHVLYTGESVVGCLIEKLQRFSVSDPEALAVLRDIQHDDDLVSPVPLENQVPASLLCRLAVSSLRVLDITQYVVQVDAFESISELRTLGKTLEIELPEMKPGDVLHKCHEDSRKLSVIVFETQNVAGTSSRSSLDDPQSVDVHVNFNLYRRTPEEGSAVRCSLDSIDTHRVLDEYRDEVEAAMRHLGVSPALALDHPDFPAAH